MKNIVFFLCAWCYHSSAQFVIDSRHQQLRIGDELREQKLEFQNDIWNLENSHVINHQHSVEYMDFLLGKITSLENGSRTYYEQNDSGILLSGYEDPQVIVNYTLKEKWLPFPFTLNDQVDGYFSGTGTYCDKLFFREFGTYQTTAEKVSSLILPNGKNIQKVLCVHTVRYKSIISTPIDTLHKMIPIFTKDSIQNYMNTDRNITKEEELRLYSIGSRYPVVVSKVSYNKKTGKNSF